MFASGRWVLLLAVLLDKAKRHNCRGENRTDGDLTQKQQKSTMK